MAPLVIVSSRQRFVRGLRPAGAGTAAGVHYRRSQSFVKLSVNASSVVVY